MIRSAGVQAVSAAGSTDANRAALAALGLDKVAAAQAKHRKGGDDPEPEPEA